MDITHARPLVALIVPITSAVLLAGTDELWRPAARPRSAAAQPAADAQRRVSLTPAEREAVVRQMRTTLRSFSLVLQGLADGNSATIEESARASGKAMALDPQLEKKLPEHYVQLDQKVRQRFDQLADATKGGKAPANAITRLAAITGYCVACHEMFRVDETR